MDKNWNFSAVRSPIGLKLSGDLGLVSQISVHVLVSRFDCFLYCKQTKEQQKRQNRGFTKLAFSPPCRVRLIWNLVGTSGQVLGIVWYVCFVYIIVCLHFVNINKENTLYGSFGHLPVKSFETWWMSLPNPNSQSQQAKSLFINAGELICDVNFFKESDSGVGIVKICVITRRIEHFGPDRA